jgi:prophage regulatory protein
MRHLAPGGGSQRAKSLEHTARQFTMHDDILQRLCLDPGQRTLGELLQDRETAVHEIRRLRAQCESRVALASAQQSAVAAQAAGSENQPLRPSALLRLAELSNLLSVSTSTIYRWVAEGLFPAPISLGKRSVRWQADEVERWRRKLEERITDVASTKTAPQSRLTAKPRVPKRGHPRGR